MKLFQVGNKLVRTNSSPSNCQASIKFYSSSHLIVFSSVREVWLIKWNTFSIIDWFIRNILWHLKQSGSKTNSHTPNWRLTHPMVKEPSFHYNLRTDKRRMLEPWLWFPRHSRSKTVVIIQNDVQKNKKKEKNSGVPKFFRKKTNK